MEANKPKKAVVTKQGIALTYHLMEFYIRFACLINSVPFSYDQKAHRMYFDKNSLKFKIWIILMPVGVFVELCRATYELLRSTTDPTMTKGDSGLILFVFISWTFITLCHYNALMRSEYMTNFLNQTLEMRKYFGEEQLPYTFDHKIVRGHISTSVLQCFAQCLMVATEGLMGKKHYMYSLIPQDYRYLPFAAVWVVYAYYRVATNFMTGYFHIFNGVFHVMTCNQVLQYRETTKMTLDEEVKTYRMLQLINNRFNTSYAELFLPVMTAFSTANIILGNYGTLRFFGTMAFDKYMNFPLMATMMMLFAFTFYPRNATVKEISDFEKNRMRWSNVEMSHKFMEKQGLKLKNAIENRPVIDAHDGDSNADPKDTDKIRANPTEVSIRHPTISENEERRQEMSTEPISNKLTVRSRSTSAGRHKVAEQKLLIARLKKLNTYTRSCPTVAVQMGTFYAIKSSTVLNIFDFIICNTISALLTT